jgi:hypothetical protein
MFFAIATLFVALSISAVAAYYSIVGLMAIFAASAVPIAIMGTVLEVGKVWTAAWLYEYWKKIPILLKTYLTIAVVVLMFITSMGIFGFLSKAHIQQTSEAIQSQSQIVRLKEQIASQEDMLDELLNSGIDAQAQINVQIDENSRKKVQIIAQYDSLVEEQNVIINEARSNLKLLETYIAQDDTRKIQALVGAKVDGQYGSGTARKVEEFRLAEEDKASVIVTQARERVSELRDKQVTEVEKIDAITARLREQIGTYVVDKERVDSVRDIITSLEAEKFELETQYRELEAEVGPVKYIAEFVYNEEATPDLLEEAVRWVIVVIIFVFDPLAVLLVIAGSMSLKEYVKNKPKPKVKEEPIASVIVDDEMFLDDEEVEDIIKKKRRKPRGDDTSRIR